MALVRLPTSTGPVPRRLALVDAERLAEIKNYIASLWNPLACPIEFLPHLAWALSVDVWDDNWSEERKRKVIAAAPTIHRFKGTDIAVEAALNAFDLNYEDVEWWETQPIGVRGTFEIIVHHENSDLVGDVDFLDQIYLSIKSAKPKSRYFTIRHLLSMHSQTKIYTAAFPSTNLVITAHPFYLDPPIASGPLRAAVWPTTRLHIVAAAA